MHTCVLLVLLVLPAVYRRTYPRALHQNQKFYQRFPMDVERAQVGTLSARQVPCTAHGERRSPPLPAAACLHHCLHCMDNTPATTFNTHGQQADAAVRSATPAWPPARLPARLPACIPAPVVPASPPPCMNQALTHPACLPAHLPACPPSWFARSVSG